MAHLECKIDRVLYSTGVPKPDNPFIQLRLTMAPLNGAAAQTSSWNGGKLIEMSTTYIQNIQPSLKYTEISGVMLHEMTYALQNDGLGTCPSELIEGLADFVQLSGGLLAAHWQRITIGDPLQGYSATAYFLEFVERRHPGFVAKLNGRLATQTYSETVWHSLTGKSLSQLWSAYKAS